MTNDSNPGLGLFRQVRIGFIAQGTTFGEWCRKAGLNHANARQAVIGSWDGPKGRALRTRILKAAGLKAVA